MFAMIETSLDGEAYFWELHTNDFENSCAVRGCGNTNPLVIWLVFSEEDQGDGVAYCGTHASGMIHDCDTYDLKVN
jgi:hypothetical protein